MALSLNDLKKIESGQVKRKSVQTAGKRSARPWETFSEAAARTGRNVDDAKNTKKAVDSPKATSQIAAEGEQILDRHKGGGSQILKALDHASTMHRKPPDHASTMHRKLPDHASTMHRKPPDHASTMHRKAPDHASTMHRKAPKYASEGFNYASEGSDHASERSDHASERSDHASEGPDHASKNSSYVVKNADHASTMHQKRPDHASTMHQKRPDHASTMHQKRPDHASTMHQTFQAKKGDLGRVIPRSSMQRDILEFCMHIADPMTLQTPFISRREIGSQCSLSASAVKIGMERLLKKGLVFSVEKSTSCKSGGAIYGVPQWVPEALKKVTQTMHRKEADHASNANVSLLVSKQTNKQTVKPELDSKSGANEWSSSVQASRLQELQSSVDRLRLDDDFKISCNDLAAAKEVSQCSAEDFLVSIEHLAFYLRSKEAGGIRSPKAWMLKQLRTGFFGPPADFVSWEAQQEAEKLRAKQMRVNEVRRLQLETFDADFALWQLEQTAEQVEVVKRKLGPGFSSPLSSPIGRALLRRHFAEETDRAHLLAED